MACKVSGSVKKSLDEPVVRGGFSGTGAIITGNTPEQFAAQTKAECAAYKKALQAGLLKLE